MSALADHLAMDRTTLTRNIDHLTAGSLVERRTPPRDRRRVNLELSDAGKTAYERAARIVAQEDARLLEHFDPGALGPAARALERLLGSLSGAGATAAAPPARAAPDRGPDR